MKFLKIYRSHLWAVDLYDTVERGAKIIDNLEEMVEMKKDGFTYAQIAIAFNSSYSYARYLIKHHERYTKK